MKQLFFCKLNKEKYLLTDEDVFCDVCKKKLDIMNIVAIHSQWSKLFGATKRYTCLDNKCLKHLKLDIDMDTFAYLVEDLPIESEPIVESNPEIGWGGRATAISTGSSNEGIRSDTSMTTLIDNTRLAGRPEGSWQGLSIGKDITKELEEKDKPMIEQDPINLLKDLQQGTQKAIDIGLNSEVRANELIEQKKAKELEDKSDEIGDTNENKNSN